MHVQVQAQRCTDQQTRVDNFMDSLYYAKVRAEDDDKAAAMLEELTRSENDWVAFKTDPDRWDKVRACDYHDNWLGIAADSSQKMTDMLNCNNENTGCLCVASSMNWPRQHPEKSLCSWHCLVLPQQRLLDEVQNKVREALRNTAEWLPELHEMLPTG